MARYPAKPDDRAWYEQFCANAKDFIEKNGIKGNPTTIKTGGLAEIPTSWDALRVGLTSNPRTEDMLTRTGEEGLRNQTRTPYISSIPLGQVASYRCEHYRVRKCMGHLYHHCP